MTSNMNYLFISSNHHQRPTILSVHEGIKLIMLISVVVVVVVVHVDSRQCHYIFVCIVMRIIPHHSRACNVSLHNKWSLMMIIIIVVTLLYEIRAEHAKV